MRKNRSARSRGHCGVILAVTAVLLGRTVAYPGHGTPPPPLPDGHGGVLIRVVWLPGPGQSDPDGLVRLEAVELRAAGGAPGTKWLSLTPLRQEFSARDLVGGQVWVVSVPVTAGEFNQIRLVPAAGAELPIGLHLVPGQWSIVTLYVGLQAGRTRGPLRLELKDAHPRRRS